MEEEMAGVGIKYLLKMSCLCLEEAVPQQKV